MKIPTRASILLFLCLLYAVGITTLLQLYTFLVVVVTWCFIHNLAELAVDVFAKITSHPWKCSCRWGKNVLSTVIAWVVEDKQVKNSSTPGLGRTYWNWITEMSGCGNRSASHIVTSRVGGCHWIVCSSVVENSLCWILNAKSSENFKKMHVGWKLNLYLSRGINAPTVHPVNIPTDKTSMGRVDLNVPHSVHFPVKKKSLICFTKLEKGKYCGLLRTVSSVDH